MNNDNSNGWGTLCLNKVLQMALAAGVILALLTPAFGQSRPTTRPVQTEVTGPVIPTAASIRAQISRMGQSRDLDKAARLRAIKSYQEVLVHIETINVWRVKSAAHEVAIKNVPARLAAGQHQLESTTTQPVTGVSPDTDLQDMEMLLSQVITQLDAAKKKRAELESEPTRRAARRLAIAKAIENARYRITEITENLASPPADAQPDLLAARRTRLETQRVALQTEIDALGIELRRYDAEQNILPILLTVESRRISQAENLRKSLQQLLNDKRKEKADLAVREAMEAVVRTAGGHPEIRKLAEENVALMTQRTEPGSPAGRIPEVTSQLRDVRDQLDRLDRRLRRLREQEKVIGKTSTFGVLLRKERAELPDPRLLRTAARARKSEMSRVQLALMTLRDQRSSLSNLDDSVESLISSIEPALTGATRENFAEAARVLLAHRLKGLNGLIKSYKTYFANLVDLEIKSRSLMEKSEEMDQYIDERILWIRSTSTISTRDLGPAIAAARSIMRSPAWAEAIAVLWADLRRHPVGAGALLAAVMALLVVHIRLARRSTKQVMTMGVKRSSMMGVVLPFAWAIAVPALICLAGWRLEAVDGVGPDTKALGAGLVAGSRSLLGVTLLLAAFWRNGLAEVRFGWTPRRLRAVRPWLWLQLVVLPVTASLIAWIRWQEQEEWGSSLGRLLLMVRVLVIALCAQRLLRPSYLLPAQPISNVSGGLAWRMRHIWQILGVGLPLVVVVLAGLGYYHTALHLAAELLKTIWFVIGVVVLNAIAVRYLGRTYDRLRDWQAQRRAERAAYLSQPGDAQDKPLPEQMDLDPDSSAEMIDRRSRQFLNAVSVAILLVGVWMIWSDSVHALGILRRFELWQYTEKSYVHTASPDGEMVEQALEQVVPVTLADLALAVVVVVLAFIAARTFPAVMRMVASSRRAKLDHGDLHAVCGLMRYAIMVAGIVIATSRLGVSWSSIQWLVAALTVGLGFGLQEIVANFVAGITIFFEKPFRIGDTITIGQTTGTVTRIRIRATTITDWDRKESIVPNKDFITSNLTNWSLSDKILRVILQVGIAYGSDTDKAEKLLYRMAAEHPSVLESPAPFVILKTFGDHSLNFELRVHISGMEQYIGVWHDLNMAIEKAFREAGITIAFPQRDTHLSTLRPLDIKIISREESSG